MKIFNLSAIALLTIFTSFPTFAYSVNPITHQQILTMAISEILKGNPHSMMNSGKTFAEEATQEEIALLIAAYSTEIYTPQSDSPLTNRDKRVKYKAMQIIAGLAPKDTVDEMVEVQITNSGPFEQAAHSVLSLRHSFIATHTPKTIDDGMTGK